MTQHTPGPWTAVEHTSADGDSGWWTVLQGAWDVSHNEAGQPGVVASAKYSVMTPTENAANARLIAAAPDLLAALEWALKNITQPIKRTSTNGDYVDAYEVARAAIAKARGNG